MTPKENILWFPVEIQSRELEYRAMLAARLAARGAGIFLGNHSRIYEIARQAGGGVYLGKTIFKRKAGQNSEKYDHLKQNGVHIVFLDEEQAIHQGDRENWKRKILKKTDPRLLHRGDDVCTWGAFQKDFFLSLGNNNFPEIHLTGHPRFDLCRPSFSFLRKPPAGLDGRDSLPLVLVNTNCKFANFGGGGDDYIRKAIADIDDPLGAAERLREQVDLLAYDSIKRAGFLVLLHRLSSAFAGKAHIVLRPHPSENLQSYREVLRNFPGVQVTREGSVLDWIQRSSVVIHNGCTTAVEAHLMGRPVVTFMPVRDPRFEYPIPNDTGLRADTADAVVDAVGLILGGNPPAETGRISPEAGTLVASMDPQWDAFARMEDLLALRLESSRMCDVRKAAATEESLVGKIWRQGRGRLRRKKSATPSFHQDKFGPWLPGDAATLVRHCGNALNLSLRVREWCPQVLYVDSPGSAVDFTPRP